MQIALGIGVEILFTFSAGKCEKIGAYSPAVGNARMIKSKTPVISHLILRGGLPVAVRYTNFSLYKSKTPVISHLILRGGLPVAVRYTNFSLYKSKTPVISRSFNHQSKNEQLIRLLLRFLGLSQICF